MHVLLATLRDRERKRDEFLPAAATVEMLREQTMRPHRSRRDHDMHKGAVEDDRPTPEQSGHPGLDQEGLPDDITAIAHDALGAKADNSQG